jgi:3,5-epimerase/4-reductase
MRILTLGKGFVADHLPYERISERVSLDWITINSLLDKYHPDVLINCIGKTGRPNVDWCESHKEETSAINTALPIMLAGACSKHRIHMIHIGSGCIYFGQSPHCVADESGRVVEDWGWKETDFANPESYYSKSKYACDLMLGSLEGVCTLRIRMPISELDTPRNLINKLRGYKQVIDIPNSVTFMSDLVRCVDWMAHMQPSGIFHVANPQPLTAAQIMREFQKRVDPDHTFEIMTEAQLNQATVAKRSNCILSTQKLQTAGFTMTPTQEALIECMTKYGSNLTA